VPYADSVLKKMSMIKDLGAKPPGNYAYDYMIPQTFTVSCSISVFTF